MTTLNLIKTIPAGTSAFILCPKRKGAALTFQDAPNGVEDATHWAIEAKVGTDGDEGEIAVFLTADLETAVRTLAQLHKETRKPIALETVYGMMPEKPKGLQDLAEDLTTEIHASIECIEEEDQRDDDFENHPLAELRELCVDYSDYSGQGSAKCPYQTDLMEKCRVFITELADFKFDVIDHTPYHAAPDESLEPATDWAPVQTFRDEAEELADNWR